MSAAAITLLATLGLTHPAAAADLHVDRRAGADGASATAGDPVRSIGAALALAQPGDRVRVAPGTYRETVRIHTDDVSVLADPDVVLEPEGYGVVVTAQDVVIEGLGIHGGGNASRGILVAEGGSATAIDVLIEDFDGVAAEARDPGSQLALVRSEVSAPSSLAVAAEDGGRVVVQDSVVRGFQVDTAPVALVQARAAGSHIRLDHTLVTGGRRSCVRAVDSATVDVEGSIVGVCGLDYDATMQSFAATQAAGAQIDVRGSLLQGQASAPHLRVTDGGVSVDAATLVNADPGYAGYASATGFLSITVDDSPNLDNAMALSALMDEHGAHLSFFANFPQNLSWAERGDVLDLVARGHEVGCHAVTNGRLTQTSPLALTWSGVGAPPIVTVGEDGTTLQIEADDAVIVGPLDLESTAHDRLWEVCDAIADHPSLGCEVISEDPTAVPIYAASSGLASGSWGIAMGVETTLDWDRRLPSEGGRHFRNELVRPVEVLEEILGAPVTSLAYPGQKHDETVRAAVFDAGFDIARGANAHSHADHLLARPFDVLQSPLSLPVTAVKGPGYEALSRPEQEGRVRAFARSWAAFALEAGAMGAVTVHGAETLSPDEVSWLLDEVSQTQVQLVSLDELRTWIEGHGETEDGRMWSVPVAPMEDYQPTATGDTVDAGSVADGRQTDALGNPIYGAPDLGPFEHQPAAAMGQDGLPLGGTARIYADGRFRVMEGGGEPVPVMLSPLDGWPELRADAARPMWADVEVTAAGPEAVAWTATTKGDEEEACAAVEGLVSDQAYEVRAGLELLGSARTDAAGRLQVVVPLGAAGITLQPQDAGAAEAAPLPACTPAAGADAPSAEEETAASSPGRAFAEPRSTGCTTGLGGAVLPVPAFLLLALVGRRRRD